MVSSFTIYYMYRVILLWTICFGWYMHPLSLLWFYICRPDQYNKMITNKIRQRKHLKFLQEFREKETNVSQNFEGNHHNDTYKYPRSKRLLLWSPLQQIKLAPLPQQLFELFLESLIAIASAIYPSNSYLRPRAHRPKINRGATPQQEQSQPLTTACQSDGNKLRTCAL